MNFILRTAWRNMTRSRARTLMSLGAVALGVMVVVLFKGFTDGMLDTFLNTSIDLNSGHVRVIGEEYRKKERLLTLAAPVDGYDHEGYQGMAQDFARVPGVERVLGRIRFGTMVSKGEQSEGTMGIGVEPGAEEAVAKLSRYIDQGRFIQEGKREIVLGKTLLDKLGLKVGDKTTLLTSDSFGALKMRTFLVVGRLNSGLRLLDEGTAYIPLDQAQAMLGMEGAVTELVVFGKNENTAAQIQQGIEMLLKNKAQERYLAIPWYEYNSMISYINSSKALMFILYALMVVLACFVVLNTFIMIVNERKREIGMLGAMGMNPREIQVTFLAEAAAVGFLGALAGTVLGSFLNWWLSFVGMDLSAYTQAMGTEMLFFPKMYPVLSWENSIFAFLLGWGVAVLAAVIPARQAAKVEPTEALRSI